MTIDTDEGCPLRFGVNYTPGKKWYYSWLDWDSCDIGKDLEDIRYLGADHIRIQLIWPWFQPNPTYLSETMLSRLDEMMTLARKSELDVLVTVLTGFLSGYTFLPAGVQAIDVFTKEEVIQSEIELFKVLSERVLPHSNFMGFDLGNEINCLQQFLPTEQGDQWGKTITANLSEVARNAHIVNGIDHSPIFGAGKVFSMEHLTSSYTAICLHTWPKFTGCLVNDALGATPSQCLTAFSTRFAQLYNKYHKPIWIQEFGANPNWGTAQEREAFMHSSIHTGIEAGATLFTWWCSHDKTNDVRFIEDEYYYGLLTPENIPKDSGVWFKEIVAQIRQNPPSLKQPNVWIDVPSGFKPEATTELEAQDWLMHTRQTNVWPLFEDFYEKIESGLQPGFRFT